MAAWNDNKIQVKSFAVAVRIMKLRRYLCYEADVKEFDISNQLLRSGTSVGANVEEAQGAQSASDFLSKISIAYKEARESRYWIRLLAGSDYINEEAKSSLLADVDELCRMLSSIIMSTKETIASGKKSPSA